MVLGTVKPVNIEDEMRSSYLDYAMSVIVSRALPDVRDGLKPVHRRILYAMNDMGLRPSSPHRRAPVSSARCWVSTIPTAIPPSTMPWCAWRRTSPCAIRWSTGRATSAAWTMTRRRPCVTPRRAWPRSPRRCWSISIRTPWTSCPTSMTASRSRRCCRPGCQPAGQRQLRHCRGHGDQYPAA